MQITKSLVVLFSITTALACAKKDSDSSDSSPRAPETLAVSTCAEPNIFQAKDLKESTEAELKAALLGKFELQEIHIVHHSNMKLIHDSAALSATVLLDQIGTSPVRVTFDCTAQKPKSVFVGLKFLVPTIVHLPSKRITIFDENSGNMDNPQFNFPRVAEIELEFNRNYSYKDVPTEVVGPAPYDKNLYVDDIIDLKNDKARYFVHADGLGFDLKVTSSGTSEYGGDSSRSLLLRFRLSEK
ncbi:MAG: hypothetical protein ACXWC9_05770 [Pseudobdellovibrionaceae bacterium]